MRHAAALIVFSAIAASPLAAQGIDMAAVQRWSQVTRVTYAIVGTFDGNTNIAAGPNSGVALANVTDGLTLDVDFDVRKGIVIGTPVFTNARSALGTLSSGSATCDPPVPRGAYEHLEVLSATASGPTVVLHGQRTFPTVDASIEWPATCARKPIAGAVTTVTETVAVPSPMMLVMPNGATRNLSVAPDRTSFTLRTGGWTWTLTPTIVQ